MNAERRPLFDAPANRSKIQSFDCAGFARPVVGTIYPRASFRWHGVLIRLRG